MSQPYDRQVYSRHFARLLNRALKMGDGQPEAALSWLEKKHRPMLTLLLSRHKLEVSDAYMDVREHIIKRIKDKGLAGETN
jgi:hypothetical protein